MIPGLWPLAVVIALGLGLLLAAEASADTPTEQLRRRIDHVVAILDDGALEARPAVRREALRGAASQIFDFTEITRRALERARAS